MLCAVTLAPFASQFAFGYAATLTCMAPAHDRRLSHSRRCETRAHSHWAAPSIFRRKNPEWVYVRFLLSRCFLDSRPRHLLASPAAFFIGLHAPSFAITLPSTVHRPLKRGRAARARPRARLKPRGAALCPQGRTCGPLRERTELTILSTRLRECGCAAPASAGGGKPSPRLLNMLPMTLSAAKRDSGLRPL
jgi:hypothetical protein